MYHVVSLPLARRTCTDAGFMPATPQPISTKTAVGFTKNITRRARREDARSTATNAPGVVTMNEILDEHRGGGY